MAKMKDYYQENAKEYIGKTMNADVSDLYSKFEKYLRPGSKILDLGFGSGRDSLYFLSKGYEVYSLDPCTAFIEHGKEIGLTHLIKSSAEDIDLDDCFDAIWANASLLHVASNKLKDVFLRCARSLKDGGVMYCSFKYGDFEGERDGRYYVDLTKSSIGKFMEGHLTIKESFVTFDSLGRGGKWLNLIVSKQGQ